MLRNRGVNATERRIRQDVLRAYEYDIFDVPRWKYMETGYQAPPRQPRYRTIPKPVYYHTARSSVFSFGRRTNGARRVYLPENECWSSSVESMIYVRNPQNARYKTRSYYPNEVFERPYRRDLSYPDGYYLGRPSTLYVDDDDMERYQGPRYCPRRPTQLSRKVTRKLSPIFTCECATTSNTKNLRRSDIENDNPKTHLNHLSKEANNLSLDIYKILSLLRKTDGEEEKLSSLSLLQNIHDLAYLNSHSGASLITQRVQVSPKMPKQKQDEPLEKFKAASGVRSKLEALVSALKQYEAEKMLNEENSDAANLHQYNDLTPSDPPSLEARSFNKAKDKNSSTYIMDKDKQKDMDLQTDEPKTSNKSVCGKIKTKKDNLIVERKSLRSRLSWKKREMRKDSSTEKLPYKLSAGKLIKTKSKHRIEPALSAKNLVREGQTNKAGLMIKIGGNPQRKKPLKEKRKDKMPKTWIRKFLEGTKDYKNNNLHIRWNNKAFYTKSSSTVVELVNHVYKQLGIRDYSKGEDISVSDIKKMTKRTAHKSTTKLQKSSNKPKHKQKIKAYMMPQIIVPGPVYMPLNITQNKENHPENEKKINTTLPAESISVCDIPFKRHFNTISYPSSNYFEIQLPKDFFEPVLTPKDESLKTLSSEEQVYNIVEYETIKSDSIEKSIIDDLSDQIYDYNEPINYLRNKKYHLNMVQMTQSLCFRKSDDGEKDMILRVPESEPAKSRLKVLDCSDHGTSIFFPRTSCSLANKIIEDECLNWMPLSADSLIWSDRCDDSDDKIFIIHDQDVSISNLSILGESDGAKNNDKDKLLSKMKQVYKRQQKISFSNNHVRLKDATGTISESLIGIFSRKPVVLSVYWNLFWGFLKTRKRKTLSPDLSAVQAPKTVSEPECHFKPQNLQNQQSLPPNRRMPFEAVRLIQSAHAILQASFKVDVEKKPKRLTRSVTSVLSSKNLAISKKQLIVKVPSPSPPSGLAEPALIIGDNKTTSLPSKPRIPLKTRSFTSVTQLEENLLSEKLSLSIKNTESQFNNQKTVEPKISLKSRALTRGLVRLVRSSLEIQNEKKIQFTLIPSVPLLQQHLQQQQILLPICPVANANDEEVLKRNLDNFESLLQDQAQCIPVSGENEPQEERFRSNAENRAGEKNNEFSLILNNWGKTENSVGVLTNKTNSGEVHSEAEKTAIKSPGSSEYSNKSECEKTKTNSKLNKNKHVYVTQTTMGSKAYSSDRTSVALSGPGSIKFSLKVTKGDQVTKICIKNRNFDLSKNALASKLKSTIQTNFKEPSIKNSVDSKEESINTMSNKNIKIYINITNANTEKVKDSESLIAENLLGEQIPKQETKKDHNSTNNYYELQTYEDDIITCSQDNTVDQLMKLHSSTKYYSANDNKLPIYVMESPNPNNMHGVDLKHLMALGQSSPVTSNLQNKAHDIALDNTPYKFEDPPTQNVVEIKRMLNAMVMFNAEMALLNNIEKEHNQTYTSLNKQMLRRKEIVNILSEMNMRKRKNNASQEHESYMNDEEYFCELESGDSCSRCNVLTRKLNSHRRVQIDNGSRSINYNFKKDNIIDNDNFPYLETPMQQSFKAPGDHVFKDKDKIDKNTISTINSTKSRKGLSCWYCRKNCLKNNRTKYLNKKDNKKEAIILTDMNPRKSQKSSVTEYKVFLKNDDDDQFIMKQESKMDKADILQSDKVKKAVLQLYSETGANEDFFVAKIPKYLKL